jgi:hypothetical protein
MIFPIFIVLPLAIVTVAFMVRHKAQSPYRILVLGPRGAGKTVFLASMYYKLSTLNPKTGFFLATDENVPEQAESLRKYKELLTNRAEADFSAPTQLRELKEWKFVCKVRGADGIYPMMRFSYYDYSGERIQNLFNAGKHTPEFQNVLNKADVLLAMLDGREILKLMRGEDNNFEEEFVNYIIPILTNSTQPVHFIITKWDLIEKHYSLDAVRSRLMESSQRFRDFVNVLREFGTLRLIPVSAVGLDFAEPGPDGTMLKKPGSEFEPYHVEMPLVSVIFDQLDYATKKLGFARQAWFKQLTRKGVIRGPIMQLLLLVAWITTAISVNMGVIALTPGTFIASIVNRFGYNVTTPSIQPGPGKLIAAQQVIERSAKLLHELDDKLPASNLTTFREKARP